MEVRDQILAAATQKFADAGFDGTSLQAIADEVGIRKPSLLYHFPSKDALRVAVHQKMLDHWNEALPRLLKAATSGEGQFDNVVSALVQFFTTDPDRARLIVREVLDRPAGVTTIIESHVRPWVDIVCNYIRKGQAHGSIYADVDPEAYVVQVINLVVASVATHACIGGILPPMGARGKATIQSRHIDELVRVAKASLFEEHEVIIGNFLKDNDDLQWYLNEGVDWDTIVEATELNKASPDAFKTTADALAFYKDIASMVGEFAADEIAPHAAEVDREGVAHVDGEAVFPPRLESIFKKIEALELHGMTLPRELGGMNAPMLLYFINSELMARADVSVMAHHGFHGGMAMAMLIFSALEGSSEFDKSTGTIVKTRWKAAIDEIAAGKAWGCMDITEPDAGSDMARLRAVGELDASGNWLVTGQKIFITSGHGKYHFVIARTEKVVNPSDPMSGLNGLSMFLVPTYDLPDGTRKRVVTLDRVEEKLGHHGSVTGALTFERAPAELVGKRGEGFKWMLFLMNNARLGVGFECIGLCEAALRLARAYAAERPSMGKTIDKHEMIADMLDEMEIDVVGIRALCMHGAYHEEIGQKKSLVARFGEGRPEVDAVKLEREAREHRDKARRVTPLLKYLGAEKAVEMARRCLQIHGGNGYMKEYGAEKLLRDALVMPIYEGTSQIQSLMAMKDTLMGIMKNPQEFALRTAQARWRAISLRDPLERRVARLSQLSLSAQRVLITRTATDKLKGLRDKPVAKWRGELFKAWNPKRDFAFAMLHAEKLTRMLADEAIAELLLSQVRKHPSRRELLERHLERAEPRCRGLLDQINSTGQRLLDQLANEGEQSDSKAVAG